MLSAWLSVGLFSGLCDQPCELADHDVLEVARSRAAEQEVLDLLDELPTGEIWLADLGSLPRLPLLDRESVANVQG